MRGPGLLLLFGGAAAMGCAFESGQFGQGGSAEPGDADDEPGGPGGPGDEVPGSDDSTDAGADEVPDAPQPRSADCDDPDVVLCFDFEDDGYGVRDDSNYQNRVEVTGDVVHLPGRDGDAVLFSPSMSVVVAESEVLDVSAFTLSLWIRPTEIPTNGRAGLLDNNGQYGLFLYPGGDLRCSPGGGASSGEGAIEAETWYHVACTVDDTDVRLFIDGVQVDEGDGGSLSTAGSTGSAVGMNSPSGDHFLGLIDSLRMWRTVLVSDEICARAGRDVCSDES